MHCLLWPRRDTQGRHRGLATVAQLKTEAHVRKPEDELRSEKDLVNKVGEQDDKLESSVCHFAARRGKQPWTMARELVTKPDWGH